MRIDQKIQPADLKNKIARLWETSAPKVLSIEKTYKPGQGAPVFTIKGKYTARGWTEWTQGFQYGASIFHFDATGDKKFLAIGRDMTINHMAGHVTHFGVHDHGFNNVSTYGNLWRLMKEGRIPHNQRELELYELAIKCSGAVQARRWSMTNLGKGYVYSFNGPQSLFVDTIRSCRALALAHALGHVMMGERDGQISLLQRALEHGEMTARFNVFYGEGRDAYDTTATRGRAVHEVIFNTNNGDYRCPSTQQGYSPFSTWTRGLTWAMLGFAEQLEYLQTRSDADLKTWGGRRAIEKWMLRAAEATCDFYINWTAADGIPYWDTGAEHMHKLGDWQHKASDPYNSCEPVDSSAAAIGAQGLLRLGRYLSKRGGGASKAARYWQAGLTVANTLFDEPYLSTDPRHQGLILHSVYHRPNGWDYVPPGQKVPNGESSMWGDYHARELAIYLQRIIEKGPYYAFFGPA